VSEPIPVVEDDESPLPLRIVQQTASQNGTLTDVELSPDCKPRARRHFVVSSDLNDSDLTSERFTVTCQ